MSGIQTGTLADLKEALAARQAAAEAEAEATGVRRPLSCPPSRSASRNGTSSDDHMPRGDARNRPLACGSSRARARSS